MIESDRLRVLIVCAQCDGEDLGESWCGFQLVSRIAKVCDVTVLTQVFSDHTPPSKQLRHAGVIEWKAFPWMPSYPRINGTLKPWYFLFYQRARKWLKQELSRDHQYDLVHHLTPMAMRFPSPCAGLNIPFIIGPIAGSLPTPDGFRNELGTEPGYTRLRSLDNFRFHHDPWLKRTFESANLVIYSSPYAAKRLEHLAIRNAAVETEVGIDKLAGAPKKKPRRPNELRMLHVGRTVRTKGLRDAIRAVAQLADLPNVTLDVAGDGEDLDACRAEAERLGVCKRVRFLGKQTRLEVENLYRQADLFLFPSFREPTGIVLFEAMRHGLPIITTDIGGPGYIVTDTCGIRVPAITPDKFSSDLAEAIRKLAAEPTTLMALGLGARERVEQIGLWDKKIGRILNLYQAVKTTDGTQVMRIPEGSSL